ncbi:TetR/AcrR family transcriptional regulator [Streptomyces sp. W16]|uniref:TetR/AcrR family transcriptional regulator n=1 Tax=Streptomyces sp. W16 TaxID=3076631 RepID=UPI00295ACBC3|nr:TetR/AcrR family transcriptional regulator [Streptomyces sp. W16]MDV9169437.1 TetR/AcrR family transcriptional regulator [Streptomyces sp. W16]
MTTEPISSRRADTRRNRERILATAEQALAESGEISFNAIAKTAGVGVGTMYRHFPTSEALVLAVYEAEVRHLVEIVPTLIDTHPPQEAFRVWVTDHLAHYMATKRGLGDALRAAATGGEVYNRAYEEVTVALAALLRANAEAGTVRPDLNPRTVMRGLGGLLLLDPNEDQQPQIADLTDLLWRGMSTNGAALATPARATP